jgi:hypothetical protein
VAGGERQRLLRVVGGKLGREQCQQLPQQGGLLVDQIRPVLQQHSGGQPPVTAGERVAHRLDHEAVAGIPAGRSPVQLRYLPGRPVAQLGPQQLGEQPVVAVPGGLLQWEDEGVGPLQLRQHALAVVAAGQGVHQRPCHRVEDCRAQQHGADLCWLALEHLADEVIGDAAVVTGEPFLMHQRL